MRKTSHKLALCAVVAAAVWNPLHAAEQPRYIAPPAVAPGANMWGVEEGQKKLVNFQVKLFDRRSAEWGDDRAFSRAFSGLSFFRQLEQHGAAYGASLTLQRRAPAGGVRETLWDDGYADPFHTPEPAVFSDLSFAFLGDGPYRGRVLPPDTGTDADFIPARTAGEETQGARSQRLPGSVLAAAVALIGLVAVARRNVSGPTGRR